MRRGFGLPLFVYFAFSVFFISYCAQYYLDHQSNSIQLFDIVKTFCVFSDFEQSPNSNSSSSSNSNSNSKIDINSDYIDLEKDKMEIEKKVEEERRVLLPKNVKPLKYDLHLIPDLERFTFEGKVSIEVEVLEMSSKIIKLHALDIVVKSVEISGMSTEDIRYTEEDETVSFYFPENLVLGKHILQISFVGNLNDLLCGFYRTKYMKDGIEKWGASTQFEPTDARRAFPCWDEPSLKAVFSVTLTVPKNMVCISNMAPESESEIELEGKDLKVVKFLDTPIMSTYLLAFVIGEYDYIETTTEQGVLMRVYTPLGQTTHGNFALEIASKCLDYFSSIYGIPFPLKKLDQIAIPDFSAGAMENWGLITYRASSLLVEEGTPLISKRRVALTVTHELAHQWFGNLVTMEWWQELWLNEGFATFMSYIAMDHLHPEWDMWSDFVYRYSTEALYADSLRNTHSVEVPVAKSSEVNEIFDHISYNKGASVIRMCYNYIGKEAFFAGLRSYLEKHKYSNAKTTDLWKALSESSGFDVSAMMTEWTGEPGYPVVSVKKSKKNDGGLVLEQQRFHVGGEEFPAEILGAGHWWIPIWIHSDKIQNNLLIDFKEKEMELDPNLISFEKWVRFNIDQTGFYRVNFDSDLQSFIQDSISSGELSSADRLGLLNNYFSLAFAGLVDTTSALNLLHLYSSEMDANVLSELALQLRRIEMMLKTAENINEKEASLARKELSLLKVSFFKSHYDRLGWDFCENDNIGDRLIRPIALTTMIRSGDKDSIAKALELMRNRMDENTTIQLHPDLYGVIFATAIRSGGEEGYNSVKKLYLETPSLAEKMAALSCLVTESDSEEFGVAKKRIYDTYVWGLKSGDVRSQDFIYLVRSGCSSLAGSNAFWEFMQTEWKELHEKYGKGQFLLSAMIDSLGTSLSGNQIAEDIENFFIDHPTDSAERTIKQVIEIIHARTKWYHQNLSGVSKWFLER